MKLILIIPPSPKNKKISRMIDCSQETKGNYLYQPHDFMNITAQLNPEDDLDFIDGTADKLSQESFLNDVDSITGGDLLIFAISAVCWKSDYEYFKEIKKRFPVIPLYLMGDIFLEETYRSHILKECDGIIFNPYLLDLVNMAAVRGIDGKNSLPGVCTSAEEELNLRKAFKTLPSNYPRHEVFLKPGYRYPLAKHYTFASIMTMFGCPFTCSYCPTANFSPVMRYPKDVVKELDHLSNLGVRELNFTDRTFGYPRKNCIDLLNEMIKRFDFSWSCFLQPQLYKPDLLDLMNEAGCHTIVTGIDSADLSSLFSYNRKVKSSHIDSMINHANRLDMSICADFILGLEHEDETDIENTIKYALKLPIDFASFNIAAPLPGSGIRKQAESDGKMVWGQEGFDMFGHKGILGNEKISPQKIKDLRAKAVRKFYLRPSYIMRRLKKTSSFEHFMIQFNEMTALFRKTA